MMSPSHLLATVILAFVISRWFPFDARDWLLALAFGVLIDIDHLFQVPAYLAQEVPRQGLAALTPTALLAHGGAWQGVFHHPVWATLIVLGACVALRSPVPAVFWGFHMFLDFGVARHWVQFASPMEFAILGGMAVLAGALGWLHYRDFGAGQPLATWARGSVAGTLAAAAALLPVRR